jgi:acyl carrier protein
MTTAITQDDILASLQRAYDVVKSAEPRTLEPGLRLIDDLDLDSLDLIDLVSVLEEDFAPEVIDTVIDRSPEITTVQELVDAFASAR